MSGTPGQVVTDALLRDWGTKAAALVLAVILFVVTRNDVTRSFQVQVRVTPDDDRVLVTTVPEAVQVEVRGPWTRVNRLQSLDLGPVVLDLATARPGPLQIDPASLVMPPGVILSRLIYDPVDLRFEAVIERDLPIRVPLSGSPDPDFEVAGVAVDPPRWTVRGGRSAVVALRDLETEVLDVSAVTEDAVAQLELMDPVAGIRLQGAESERPRVRARVVVKGVSGERVLDVTVSAGDLDNSAVPGQQSVRLRGPIRALRRLSEITDPLVARAVEVLVDGEGPALEIRVRWREEVPEDLRQSIQIDPRLRRIPLEVSARRD